MDEIGTPRIMTIRMNILYIPQYTGPISRVDYVKSHLIRKGHTVHILDVARYERYKIFLRFITQRSIPTILMIMLSIINALLRTPPLIVSLIQKIRAEQIDAVICYNPIYDTCIPALIACHITNKPLLVDYLDIVALWTGKETTLLQKLLYAPLEIFLIRHADSTIFVSKTWEELVRNILKIKKKTYYIPNGVDLEIFDPKKANGIRFRSKHNLGNRPIILYTGHPWKVLGTNVELQGIEFTIKSIPYICKSFPETVFVFMGFDPDDCLAFNDLAKSLSMEEHVVFLGRYVFGSDNHLDALAAANVLCLPATKYTKMRLGSRFKVFEYMAMARPIVASKTEEIAYLLKDIKASLAENENEISLAEHIVKLLLNERLSSMVANRVRSIVEQKYDWKILAMQYEYALIETISSKYTVTK